MKLQSTTLPGVLKITPETFSDRRGFFHVLWDYEELHFEPVYQYTTQSSMGTLRGLHCQTDPFTQAKIVQVLAGSIFDVVVSMTEFARYEVFYLTFYNHLFIPPGYAHGFYVNNSWADVVYLLDEHYHPECEQTIDPFDKDLGIAWNIRKDVDLLMSEKDKNGMHYADAFLEWKRYEG